MLNVTNCPCCDTLTQTIIPAYLSQFVVWRTTKIKPNSNVRNLLIRCDACDFHFSNTRFTDEEIARLYQEYRGDQYNRMRLECEPNYKVSLYSAEYIKQRKEFINKIIEHHVINIKSVLDYGGDDGAYIPERLDSVDRYVFDLSGVDPLPGIKNYVPTEKQSFDLVMNCQVLEHVSDINVLIKELKNLTKNYIYVEVPTYQKPPPVNVIIGEHINFFRGKSLQSLLNKHNINIIKTVTDYNLGVLGILGKI
jgi:hypothetical protein